jgi:hypothetical protein
LIVICRSVEETSMSQSDTPKWTWPAGRAVVLYHWSWFDPELGQVIVGWSHRNALDEAGYAHLEPEALVPARSLWVDPEARDFLFVEPETYTALTRLPPSLQESGGRPLAWIRELLGEKGEK